MNADRDSGRLTGRRFLDYRVQAGFLALFVSTFAATVPALAQNQSMQPVFDRLERLERDIRTLNQQIARPGTVPPAATAPAPGAQPPSRPAEMSGDAYGRLDARLATLEDDLRTMTGRNEEVLHRLSQMESRLEKLASDIDFRLGALEKSAAGDAPAGEVAAVPPAPTSSATVAPTAPSSRSGVEAPLPGASPPGVLGTIPQSRLGAGATPPAATTAAPPSGTRATAPAPAAAAKAPAVAALPPGTAQEQYAYAQQFLFSQKFDEAEKSFSAFLTAHPNDPLAGNARYWLGEARYARAGQLREAGRTADANGQYSKAAEIFAENWQKDPKGGKAPDSLLKLAMAFAKIGKTNEACITFDKLRTDYPNAQNTIKLTATKERQQAGCR